MVYFKKGTVIGGMPVEELELEVGYKFGDANEITDIRYIQTDLYPKDLFKISIEGLEEFVCSPSLGFSIDQDEIIPVYIFSYCGESSYDILTIDGDTKKVTITPYQKQEQVLIGIETKYEEIDLYGLKGWIPHF